MHIDVLTRSRSAVVSLALFAGLCLVPGCGSGDSGPTGSTQSYSTRGVIESVSKTKPVGPQVMIHHEPVPNFVDDTGTTEDMDSMTMPFPVAPAVSLDNLRKGQKVRFDFDVAWDSDWKYRITSIEPLPVDTKLDFGNAGAEDGGMKMNNGDNGDNGDTGDTSADDSSSDTDAPPASQPAAPADNG